MDGWEFVNYKQIQSGAKRSPNPGASCASITFYRVLAGSGG